MNYSEIKYFDIANGEGVRTSRSLFRAVGAGAQDASTRVRGALRRVSRLRARSSQILKSLEHPFCEGLTVLGGEPMEPENQRGLVDFLERVRAVLPREKGRTIWCFTGDTLDELMPGARHHTEVTDRVLDCIDVLVERPVGAGAPRHLAALPRLLQPAAHRPQRHARRRRGARLLACRCRLPVAGEQVYATHSM